MYYQKENEQATRELKKLVKGIKNIRFNKDDKTGFVFETDKGEFWFQCEVVDLKKTKGE